MSAGSAYDVEGRRKYVTRTEGRRFLSCVAELPTAEALFCLTVYYTGCRISEALNMSTDDVDMDAAVVIIHSLKKRGKRLTRRVPVPAQLASGLSEITRQSKERLWPYSRTTGWRIIKAAMKRAGISGIHATPKGLRHGFGVRGAMEQIPVSIIQDWLGHADPSTTAIYLDVRDEEERALIERTW